MYRIIEHMINNILLLARSAGETKSCKAFFISNDSEMFGDVLAYVEHDKCCHTNGFDNDDNNKPLNCSDQLSSSLKTIIELKPIKLDNSYCQH
ncbi:hypothetical protein BLOT_012159 [Blomia tropicalis]|nr:hypothetical protein BLOT_012159 [Blomia tropicalis]